MGALRELFAEFFVNFDKERTLEKGNKEVSGLAEHILGIGKTVAAAFAVDAVVEFTHGILEQADALAKQGTALGVSVDWLQGWGHAAKLSGASAEEFAAAFTKFNRNVSEAANNAKGPAAEAFKALGVNIKTATDELGKPEDLLDGVVEGLENIQDPATRTAVVMDLFGKSGARLLPLFSEGKEGIAKLRAEVGELGASFDEAFLENAQEFNDNVDRLKLGVKGLAIQAIGPLLPYLSELAQSSVQLIKSFVQWVRHGRVLQTVLVFLTTRAVGGLWSSLPGLIARLGGARVALMRLGAFALKTVAPFLLLEDILVFLAGGKSLIGDKLDKWFGKGTADSVRNFVKAAKSAPGEVRAAFADLPKDMRKSLGAFGAFLGGWGQSIVDVGLFAVDVLTNGWENALEKIAKLWDGLATSGAAVWTEIKFAGLSVAAALSDQWDNVVDNILYRIGSLQSALGKLLSYLPGFEDLGKEMQQGGLERQQRATDKQGPSASEEIGRQWDEARLKLAREFDDIVVRLKAPATKPGEAPAPGQQPGLPPPATGVAAAPVQQVRQQTIHAPVTNKVQVSNTFQVPEGTPQEQQRDMATAATQGTKKAFDAPQLRARLVPTPGT